MLAKRATRVYLLRQVERFSPVPSSVPTELETALAQRLAEARRAYPGVMLSENDYYAHVVAKLAALGDGGTPRA